MKKILFAAILAFASVGHVALAENIYDFEGMLSGFEANGGGVTVAGSGVGVTGGSTALNISVVQGATFVGALTSTVPLPLGNPPGLERVFFDLTIVEPFAVGLTPRGFASLGVTIFGASQPGPGQLFGLPTQFSDIVALETFDTPGTFEVSIDLASATHPTTFATNQSFNQIFGTFDSGANDIIPTGFQFFVNKSNNAPLSIYIDNVRTVSAIPEPSAFAAIALIAAGGFVVRRRRFAKKASVVLSV